MNLTRYTVRVVTVLSFGASAANAQAESQDSRFHRTILPNGLEVIVVEEHSVPLATVLVAVRTGAHTQQPNQQGIAHLYEHLMFRAYGNDASDFPREATRLNAAYNGGTSEEVVTYYLMLPSERADDGVRLLGRLMTRARFRSEDVQRELPMVIDEWARAESDPEQSFERQIWRKLWGDIWHRKDVIGDSSTLLSIHIEQLESEYARWYVPNNSALIVTGDVSPDVIVEAAEDHFDDWERAPDPFLTFASNEPAPLPGTSAVLVASDVRDVTVRVALRGPSVARDSVAAAAAESFFELINDPRSSWQKTLVSDGLFYELTGSYRPLVDVGSIVIEGTTSPENAMDALVHLNDAVDRAATFLEGERQAMQAADRLLQLDMALLVERTAALAPLLASFWSRERGGGAFWRGAGGGAAGYEDVVSFAETYLGARRRVFGVLGPRPVIERLRGSLGGARPE